MKKCWYILKKVGFRNYDFIPLNPTGRWKIVYDPDSFNYFYSISSTPDLYIEHESEPGVYQWIKEYDLGEDYERFEYMNDCNAVLPENEKMPPLPPTTSPNDPIYDTQHTFSWFNAVIKKLSRNIS